MGYPVLGQGCGAERMSIWRRMVLHFDSIRFAVMRLVHGHPPPHAIVNIFLWPVIAKVSYRPSLPPYPAAGSMPHATWPSMASVSSGTGAVASLRIAHLMAQMFVLLGLGILGGQVLLAFLGNRVLVHFDWPPLPAPLPNQLLTSFLGLTETYFANNYNNQDHKELAISREQ